MGNATKLGLKVFTVEAWVRRTGKGSEMNTGVGGLNLVPLMGKGRGENDGSNLDCNYAIGFRDNAIGADFEDNATGLNHPVVGIKTIPWNEWHHVAVSYDGTVWRIYVDGELDATAAANATPRNDSIQHFGLGTAFNSTGVAAGRFAGGLDEVRVWSVARSEKDIAANMRKSIVKATGLVGRWALDPGTPGADTSGNALTGTVTGATALTPGAPVDRGTAPSITMELPKQKAVVSGMPELSALVSDPDTGELTTRFYLREVTEADDFTIAVLPDTQYYTVQGKGLERYFRDQTKWVMEKRAAYNIIALIHNGDIVDHGDRFPYEWTVADGAMKTLETAYTGAPYGLPYGVGVGNHDQTPNGTASATKSFNEYFGVSRFEKRPYYGGHYGTKNDESWFTFNAGGLEFVVVNLQYNPKPSLAVLAWARSVFLAHPNAFGILNTHYLLGAGGAFGAQSKQIYEALRDVDNLQLMTGGHVSAESRRTDTYQGNVIHSMLADYQFRANGGGGFMRIWEFSPSSGTVTVRSYSPTANKFETDADSEFTLPVDLPGAGKPFRELARKSSTSGQVSVPVAGLLPGRTYEWYSTVSDCESTSRSPIWRFTTPK